MTDCIINNDKPELRQAIYPDGTPWQDRLFEANVVMELRLTQFDDGKLNVRRVQTDYVDNAGDWLLPDNADDIALVTYVPNPASIEKTCFAIKARYGDKFCFVCLEDRLMAMHVDTLYTQGVATPISCKQWNVLKSRNKTLLYGHSSSEAYIKERFAGWHEEWFYGQDHAKQKVDNRLSYAPALCTTRDVPNKTIYKVYFDEVCIATVIGSVALKQYIGYYKHAKQTNNLTYYQQLKQQLKQQNE